MLIMGLVFHLFVSLGPFRTKLNHVPAADLLLVSAKDN